tara:strand:- start:11258 stop:11698 length:441 start_codon:yes stop_codon:yes gene_type:complete
MVMKNIKIDLEKVNSKLHWTTLYSEKILLAVIGTLTMLAAGMDIYNMVSTLKISLADLFLLFIYAEIIGMVGAFYISNRIPVTLPIVIAMTALCRLIVLHSKDADPWVLIAEAGAILVLGGAAYIMSYKDKLSLEKEQLRKQNESS